MVTAVLFFNEKNGTDFHFLIQGLAKSRVVDVHPITKNSGQTVGLVLDILLKIMENSKFRIDGTF